MKDVLALILDDLKALKRDGVGSVSVDEKTLSALKSAVESLGRVPVPASLASPAPLPPAPAIPAVPSLPAAPALPEISTSEELESAVRADALFKKHASEGKVWLTGNGSVPAKILFCGDMPSAEDEVNGRVFSDASGEMLGKILKAAGISAEDCFFTNLLKWRTDAAVFLRDPAAERAAVDYCAPFFKVQTKLVKPRLIIALGAVAARFFSGNHSAKISELRGNTFEFDGVKVIATFHPNYLVRSGTMRTKRALWEDMLAAMEFLNLPVSDRQRGYFLQK